TKEWAKNTGKQWEPYWKDENTRLLHFIGKDNIVFHCIIFPSILKAEGSYILPDNVPANEFLNLEGNKISTSKNWAVWLHEFLEELPGKEDVLRYVLCANAPETKDNDFTWKDFQARNNNELVAILGNFVNRTVVLTEKYYKRETPAKGQLFDIDEDVIDKLKDIPSQVEGSLDKFKFREALTGFMELARLGNKYLADTEPWKLIKENPERVRTIMNIAINITANISIIGEPFLPKTMSKLRAILGIEKQGWKSAGNVELIEPKHKLNKSSLLFEKIEDDVVEKQIKKLENTKETNQNASKEVEVAPLKNEIDFNAFMGMDMRVGTVLDAVPVPKSNKLLKLTIDTGIDKRTVLSGIAKHFEPEEVKGRQVVVLANLAPRKMMGEVSQGMVLMAEDAEGNLRFIAPSEKVNPGSTIS
ncbi:MAG: methionine--tRNA ligase subunit beta, partial [Fulvivirga sp.]|nr:methionine--tRNA ligase subunit beta [Fulvivirga sp.]